MRTGLIRGMLGVLLVLVLAAMPLLTASAAEVKVTRIRLLAPPAAYIGYIMSFALADLINKHSDWLRADAVETSGSIAAIKSLIASPERRKDSITTAPTAVLWLAKHGERPFDQPWEPKILAQYTEGIACFITTDPKIKTYEDMIGQAIAAGGAGRQSNVYREAALALEALGILDKVNLLPLGPTETKEALAMGTVKIGFSTFMRETGDKFMPSSEIVELMAVKKIYPVQIDLEKVRKYGEEKRQPVFTYTVPEKQLLPGGDWQTAAHTFICWACDITMDDEIVREICRIRFEYAGKFQEYHALGKGMTPCNSALGTWTEEEMHPAALDFWKEKGAPIGMAKGF